MKQEIKSWNKKRKQQQHEQELITRRETALFNLLNDLTTEESLMMFNDVRNLFFSKMDSRLNFITEEKRIIEIFLEKN